MIQSSCPLKARKASYKRQMHKGQRKPWGFANPQGVEAPHSKAARNPQMQGILFFLHSLSLTPALKLRGLGSLRIFKSQMIHI